MFHEILINVKLFFVEPSSLFDKIGSHRKVPLVGVFSLSLLILLPVTLSYMIRSSGVHALTLHRIVLSYLVTIILFCVGIGIETTYILVLSCTSSYISSYKKIFTGLVYCRIPLAVGSVLYAFIPDQYFLDMLFGRFAISSNALVMAFIERLDVFELWMLAVEIVAVNKLAKQSILKSSGIIISFWLFSVLSAYFYGSR